MKINIRRIVIDVFLVLPGTFFLFTGFRWLFAPDVAAAKLLMPLLKGTALSSQMGDVGGLFMGMGLLVMGAVVTRKREWLSAVAVILACVAILRVFAFSLHDAGFVPQMIIFEAVLSVWFGIASGLLKEKEDREV
jgi:hypothetical protein